MQTETSTSKTDTLNRFRTHVSSGKADFFKAAGIDFVFGRRQGPFVWDAHSDKKLINCHCNGGVFNLGHRHPKVIEALIKGLDTLDIGNHHLISQPRAFLASKFAELLPGDLTYTAFSSGGGEAMDIAIKLARGYTGRQTIISATGGYHGHTGLALATGDDQYRTPFGPNLPGFTQVPFNNIEALRKVMDERTAAVVLETIPATLGMPIPAADYFMNVLSVCRENGALLILDEVQTGLGRTGKFWGCDHFTVAPDILVAGKGLSGGIFPMAATCFTQELETFFHDRPFIHVSTFGGAELGCPVALAVLELSSAPEFLAHVRSLAERFNRGVHELSVIHPEILVGLRQLGLMMGLEMVNEACGPVLTRTLYDNGVLSVYANNDTRISQLLPPLIIDEPLVDEILERLDSGLNNAKTILGLTR